MGYKKTDVDISSAFNQISEYEYAYVCLISQVFLCRTDQIPQFNREECIEARFFSGEKEMHIFEGNEGMQAVKIEDLDDNESCVKVYKLASKFGAVGKKIQVKEYLDFDEDGQVYVALTRLMGII